MNTGTNTLNQPDPIKSDLWYTMTITELQNQRLILSDRYDTLSLMVTSNTPLSVIGLSNALMSAISQIDGIISQKQQKNNNGRN